MTLPLLLPDLVILLLRLLGHLLELLVDLLDYLHGLCHLLIQLPPRVLALSARL